MWLYAQTATKHAMKTKPLIPLLDYLRIHGVIRSVLDSVDAHTAHACMFFSIAGAAILREFYKKDAIQVAGAAFFLVNERQRNVISFATLTEGRVQSSDTAFHAWVQCDGYVIDFMAPISSVPTFFRGERADWARNPGLNPLRVA